MSLAYWPESACPRSEHCPCLPLGGRCCYCRHTASTAPVPHTSLDARSGLSIDSRALQAMPRERPPLEWPQLGPRAPRAGRN